VKNSSEADTAEIVGVIAAEKLGGAAQLWRMPSLLDDPLTSPHTARHLDELEAAAHEEGFARGHADGYAAGAALARDQAQKLSQLLDHLARPVAEFDAEVERMLVALTIEVGRRLVNAQLELDPAITAEAVREALEALGGTPRDARVHLHPRDLEVLKNILAPPSDGPQWRFVADNSLRPGDCRIVTEGAQIDAQLDTRQASLARSLLGEAE
jgi:flagellar assembly protein FliH